MTKTRDSLNAFLDLPEAAVSNANSGPLSGLTLAVKDIFDVAGYVSGWGNPMHAAESQPARATAPTVQRLLDAGARFVGKTQTEELAFSMIGQNVHFPHPINPNAHERITGGSSSGSAAAIAGGLAEIATGSDTGGSIRVPASFCGLIGLRTTHGRISLEGTMPLSPSFDTFGWFAKDIETYEKVGKVLLAGLTDTPSHPASASLGHPLPAGERNTGDVAPSQFAETSHEAQTTASPQRGESGRAKRRPGEGAANPRLVWVGVLDALVTGAAEAAEYRRLANLVSDVLGPIRPTSPPPHEIDDLYWCNRKLAAYEAWAAHGPWISSGDRRLGKAVYNRFAFGKTISAEEVRVETARRNAFREDLRDMLGDDGFIVMPTVPCPAPQSDVGPEGFAAFREQALRMLCWSGLSGFPQITLPLGLVDGAPFGISLLGPADSDMSLIALGRKIIEATGKA